MIQAAHDEPFPKLSHMQQLVDYQIYEYAELYNLIMTEVCHGVRATNYRRR